MIDGSLMADIEQVFLKKKLKKKKKKKKNFKIFIDLATQYQPSETHAWPCVPIDGFGIGP